MKRQVEFYVTYYGCIEVEAEDDKGAIEAARETLIPTDESDDIKEAVALRSISQVEIQAGAEHWDLCP